MTATIKLEFSSEKLSKLLKSILNEITEGNLSIQDQQEIWNALMWDKDDPVSKEMIKCLFTGWWVQENLKSDSGSC